MTVSTSPPSPTGASVATTTPTEYKPDKPKFGDIAKVGHDTWEAWTGGKPNGTFTDLTIVLDNVDLFAVLGAVTEQDVIDDLLTGGNLIVS